MRSWPAWLDDAETAAKRADTCVDHMQPLSKCLRGHLIRSAFRELVRAVKMR